MTMTDGNILIVGGGQQVLVVHGCACCGIESTCVESCGNVILCNTKIAKY